MLTWQPNYDDRDKKSFIPMKLNDHSYQVHEIPHETYTEDVMVSSQDTFDYNFMRKLNPPSFL
jgi:hypothetical protein